MIDVVVAGAGPNGLMLACELGLAGIRPVVLDPMPGPNPQPRANGIIGQGVRTLDHRGLYNALAGTAEPSQRAPRSMFAAFALDQALVPDSQAFMLPVQQPRLVQVLADRAVEYDADIRWGHRLIGFDQHADGVTVHVADPDGAYELTAKYLVGADGGSSPTRKLAGVDFPGMSSYDMVARMAFDVLPPDEWVDPVSSARCTRAGSCPVHAVLPRCTRRFRMEHARRQVGGAEHRTGQNGSRTPQRRHRRRGAHERGRAGGQRPARAGRSRAAAGRFAWRAA